MNDDISPRLTRIRDALVERVETASPRRKRPPRSTVIAVVAAFVVGGALSGGLTAAAAAGSGDQNSVQALMASSAKYDVSSTNYGTLVGAPRFEIGRGSTEISLGTPPAGANAVEVAFQCLDPGTFTQRLGGVPTGTVGACGVSTTEVPSTTAPDAYGQKLTSSGSQTFSVTSTGSARFAVWISWAKWPPVAQPSDQQLAEIAGGTVTLNDYVNAFNRLEACMNEAGFPQGQVPLSGDRFDYAISESGIRAFDTRCYPREFEKVDDLWQTEHPQN